jgi:hypothetical protein
MTRKYFCAKCTWIVLSAFLFAANSNAANIVGNDNNEVVYFFTYDCVECYQAEAYLSAWDLLNTTISIRRIPRYSKQTGVYSQRLFFLLEQTSEKYKLNDFERRRAAYSIFNDNSEPRDMMGFVELFEKYGMSFSFIEFSEWWKNSEKMLSLAKDVESLIPYDYGYEQPLIRISHSNGDAIWLSGSGEKLLAELNRISLQ